MTDYMLLPEINAGAVMRDDFAVIPPTDHNADWDAYQRWLAEGNEPLPYIVISGWPLVWPRPTTKPSSEPHRAKRKT